MTDRLSPEQRSWNMSRVRSRDTKPEVAVRALLHSLGLRFRLNSGKRLFGKPDVVLPKYRTAVFVHGCFWHRHEGCRFASMPGSRVEFWNEKFRRNRERDRLVQATLEEQGWRIVIIWSCELKDPDKLREQLRAVFGR